MSNQSTTELDRILAKADNYAARDRWAEAWASIREARRVLASEARRVLASAPPAPDQSDHANALRAQGDHVVLGVTRRLLAAVDAGDVGTARAWAEVAEILGRVQS